MSFLPDELWGVILTHCEWQERLRVQSVCTTFHAEALMLVERRVRAICGEVGGPEGCTLVAAKGGPEEMRWAVVEFKLAGKGKSGPVCGAACRRETPDCFRALTRGRHIPQDESIAYAAFTGGGPDTLAYFVKMWGLHRHNTIRYFDIACQYNTVAAVQYLEDRFGYIADDLWVNNQGTTGGPPYHILGRAVANGRLDIADCLATAYDFDSDTAVRVLEIAAVAGEKATRWALPWFGPHVATYEWAKIIMVSLDDVTAEMVAKYCTRK